MPPRRSGPIAIAWSRRRRGEDPFDDLNWWPIIWLGLAFAMLASAMASGAEPPPPAVKLPADHAERMTRGTELFKTDIVALLNTHCVSCHGGKKTEAGLDLTSREGLLQGGDTGPAVVPFSAKESLLWKLVAHADEPAMPYEQDKLPAAALTKLSTWIDDGAPYDKPLVEKGAAPKGRAVVTDEDRKFWSFQPLRPQSPPQVKNEAWCRTPIDRFVLAKLAEKNLTPNGPAERRKLIRRASFDLLGLPPTPAEVEAFVADPSPQAYENLIDTLLKSPHYGERWGRHWLDLARFAESHGYEQDYDRAAAYHFRDFVIKALNDDMPYDRFVKLQIAGDEFEPDNPQAMMATGFLGAGTHATQITANQVEKERYDELDDMAATVGTAMLGLTIGCARCHDHKFDPIPQQDYYRLLSTFTTTVRSEIDLDLEPERNTPLLAAFEKEHALVADKLALFERDELPQRFEVWLQANPEPPNPAWLVLEMESLKSEGKAKFDRQSDGSYLASGPNVNNDKYTFVANVAAELITAVRLEALADKSLVKQGPGRAKNGNFALTHLEVTASPLGGKEPAQAVKLKNARATFEQKGLPVAAAIDGDPKSGWAVDPEFGKDQAAVFEFETPINFASGAKLTFTLKFDNNTSHSIGRPRLAVSTTSGTVEIAGESSPAKTVAELTRLLHKTADKRSAADKAALLAAYRTTDAQWQELKQAVTDHLAKKPKPALTKVMVTSEGLPAIRLHTQGADFFEKTYFLKRGDLNQKTGEASQGFLQVLMRSGDQEKHWQQPPPAGWRTSHRRAALARWLTDVDQGAGSLLARVIANRLWQHHFGRGLVSTPSDFGAQGQRPSHPELLDHLAGELVASGWRLKSLHKAILTSTAYMQDHRFDAKRSAADPDNILIWRHEPRRLEAEAIRDSMLAVSGLLDRRMFGPGTLDEGHKRRSIYFTIKRSKLIPMMTVFDAPDSLQGLGERAATTIAPQALFMMNNPQVSACAKSFAQRLIADSSAADEDRVRQGYLAAFGRLPSESELADMQVFLASQTESYRDSGKPNAADMALADLCRTLMSLNEFVYIE